MEWLEIAESSIHGGEAVPASYKNRVRELITRELDDYLSDKDHVIYMVPIWSDLQARITALEAAQRALDPNRAKYYSRVFRVISSDYNALRDITSRS